MRNFSSLQGPEGRALGVDIIDQLSVRALSVSVENYELWLTHRLGANAELSRAIEAAGADISQAICDALYEKHLASARAPLSLVETGDSIARELADILSCLRETGEETRSYGAVLNAAAAFDTGSADPALFRAMVRDLAVTTRAMSVRNQTLSAQIEQSAEQVNALQTALAHVKTEALTDALTGLANRRCFETTLARKLAAPHQEGAEFSLVFCDIDHFKRINDNWGHPVGDQVIRFVAHVLKRTAPPEALVARYGGEEFALILPRTSRAKAAEIGESARRSVSAQRISKRSSGQMIGAVTVSFGVAVQRSGDNACTLIERADRRLYAAKLGGRDRIVADDAARSAA
jgi:diguanylate cyclase